MEGDGYDNHDFCLTVLEHLKYVIEKHTMNDDFDMELYFYDSAKKYPDLVGTEYESKRWELRFYNLTHKRRKSLVKELINLNFTIGTKPYRIYSES